MLPYFCFVFTKSFYLSVYKFICTLEFYVSHLLCACTCASICICIFSMWLWFPVEVNQPWIKVGGGFVGLVTQNGNVDRKLDYRPQLTDPTLPVRIVLCTRNQLKWMTMHWTHMQSYIPFSMEGVMWEQVVNVEDVNKSIQNISRLKLRKCL